MGWRRLFWIGVLWSLLPRLLMAGVTLPQPLEPWRDWALRSQPTIDCPFYYSSLDHRYCAWPGKLQLAAAADGIQFSQTWQVFADSTVPLPGGEGYWPTGVQVDGVAALVVEIKGAPHVRLAPGHYSVNGAIPWQRIPESLMLPPISGLVGLTMAGAEVAHPNLDQDGRLWFSAPEAERAEEAESSEDKLTVRVYRRLTDSVPFVMATQVDLEVSGSAREVVLGKVLFDQFTPRRFNSPLPARVDPDGRLRLQLRPGQWQVQLEAHRTGPVDRLFFETAEDGFWPEEEVWVFESRPELRQVRLEGAESIDPAQTALPQAWRQWPAYHLQQGQALDILELRRGDPQPSPNQLNVVRAFWLDFDGTGFTVRDRLQGQIHRDWRLHVQADTELGSLTLNSEPQVITEDEQGQGVEVRQSRLQADALSRVILKPGTHKQRISAIGWQHDVDSLQATVNIPPGWRVLMAAGMERSSNTWFDSWSVWDVFIVLITVAAMWRLRGAAAGALSGVALVLIYPESASFLYLLLNVIAVMTALALLPAGRLNRMLTFYRAASLLLLVLWLLGFMVEQARLGLYPQLAQPWNRMGESSVSYVMDEPPATRMMEEAGGSVELASMPMKSKLSSQYDRSRYQEMDKRDPNRAAQTGPGLPSWQWMSTHLYWSGPVTAAEDITLWLLSPIENRVLSWMRVGLSIVILLIVVGVSRQGGQWRMAGMSGARSAAGLALVPLALLLSWAPDSMAETAFPPQALLDEVGKAYWQDQDCTPGCVAIESGHISIDGRRVTVRFVVHAAQDVAVPLPDSQKQWRLDSVLLDGAPHLLQRSKGKPDLMMALVPKGEHRLVLSGLLEGMSPFQLTFRIMPHNVSMEAAEFEVRGLEDGRLLSNTVHFNPRNPVVASIPESTQLTPDPISPFVRVERVLRLGRNWYMETRVHRVAPQEGGISLDIPLIQGESVTSRDIEIDQGVAKVVLKPGQQQAAWFSSLEKTSQLPLQAQDTALWAEQWEVDVSPLWHMTAEGLAPVKETGTAQKWSPRWQPYPGESLTVSVSKPKAVAGATKTIDRVVQLWEPGARESRGNLRLHLLTSKGTEQRIELPMGARVKSVKVDDEVRSVDEENPLLIVSVNPGEHWVEVDWRQPSPDGWRNESPVVNIEGQYVNHQLQVNVPRNRWVLFVGGPSMGPAILFWGMLLVLVMVGYGLGRITALPLRSWHWIVLMVGLCAGWVETVVVVALWFFALSMRQQPWFQSLNRTRFNALQVLIVLFSIFTLGLLLAAIPNGLIGSPDMGVVGNGSSQYALNWFVDRGEAELASAWYVSLPLWLYRGLMLIWSLWLVVYMLRWFKWAWAAFTLGGHWRPAASAEPSANASSTESSS